MIKGLEHTAVCAKDTKALADWYVEMLDMKIVYDNGKGTYFTAMQDGSMIEIIQAKTEQVVADPGDFGLRHFALSVDEEGFDAAVEKLKAAGVEVVTDVAVSSKGIKTFFFRDIEGNIFHLIYRPTPLV